MKTTEKTMITGTDYSAMTTAAGNVICEYRTVDLNDATQEAAEQLATFTPDSLTIAGETFAAGYSRSYWSELVHVLVEMDGQRYRIDIPADHPAHAAALAALAGETAQADEAAVVELCGAVKPVEAEPIRRKYLTIRRPPMPGSIPAGALEVGELERPQYVKGVGTVHGWVIYDRDLTEDEQLDFELIAEADAQLKPAAPKQERPERTPEEQAAKAAHGPVPEKLWVGSSFQGKGWKIVFDGDLNRTRVIFARKPSAAALEAVKAAGFYWAPSMKSWNKGLTWKAFRASEALHLELQRICG